MAAIYFNIKKNRGFLNRMPVDAKRLHMIQIQGAERFKTQNINWNNDLDNILNDYDSKLDSKTSITEMNKFMDPMYLWKKKISSQEKTNIELANLNQKILDSFNAVISLICIVLSIVDFEFNYFPTYYPENGVIDESEYKGNLYRWILMSLSFVLIFISYYSCKLQYYQKYEKGRIAESKLT